jgi:putative phosphoribosyl transferase
MEKYLNRYTAGKALAIELEPYSNRSDIIVLALPRGGVPVAFEVAKTLLVPLDVFIVRKLGVPGHEELAMGAIAMGGITFFNEDIIKTFSLSKETINLVLNEELQELKRREKIYRGQKTFPVLKEKTIILIDDGIATGATLTAAIKALNQLKPAHIIVAVPVAEITTCKKIEALVSKLVCPFKTKDFYAVGQYYEDFSQTTDEEVSSLLEQAKDF